MLAEMGTRASGNVLTSLAFSDSNIAPHFFLVTRFTDLHLHTHVCRIVARLYLSIDIYVVHNLGMETVSRLAEANLSIRVYARKVD